MDWNPLVPELIVGNYLKAKTFYQEVFGFNLCYERPEDNFGYFDLSGAQVMLLQGSVSPTIPQQRDIHFQVEVTALPPLLERLQQNHIALESDVTEAWYRGDNVLHGQREFYVRDLDRYLYRFCEYLLYRFFEYTGAKKT